MTETFIKERKHTLTGKVEKVGIDDACAMLARFTNGSLATFESTRYARGHKALYTLEINGEHASIFWDLHDLHRLQYFDHRDEGIVRGWFDPRKRRRSSQSNIGGSRPQIGYEHISSSSRRLCEGLETGKPADSTATRSKPSTFRRHPEIRKDATVEKRQK
jgi:predicted dehydrogenase